MRRTIFIALSLLPLLSLMSCIVVGNVYRHESIEQLEPGMTEREVIAILGSQPMSRSVVGDGYLLQWQYSYGTGLGTGGARHLAIQFSNDNKMVQITHDSRIGSGLGAKKSKSEREVTAINSQLQCKICKTAGDDKTQWHMINGELICVDCYKKQEKHEGGG